MSEQNILDYYKGVDAVDNLSRTRGEYDIPVFTGGLHISENNEGLKESEVVNTDGFITYKGLWTKDFSLVGDTEQVVDNINLALDTSLPVCTSSSEIIEYEDWAPWLEAYEPPTGEADFEENADTRNFLAFVSGTITSMQAGETKYVSVVYNTGPTNWYLNVPNLESGSITHKKVSNTKARYTASPLSSGSFGINVRDSCKNIERVITISSGADWYIYKNPYYYSVRALSEGNILPISLENITLIGVKDTKLEATTIEETVGSDLVSEGFFAGVSIGSTSYNDNGSPVNGGYYSDTLLSNGVIELQSFIDVVFDVSGITSYPNSYLKYETFGLVTVTNTFVYNHTNPTTNTGYKLLSGERILSLDTYINLYRVYNPNPVSIIYEGEISGESFSYTITLATFTPTTTYTLVYGQEV